MNFLCIIPARSGSTGIKNKNIKKIKNYTLIERTYIFCKKISEFNEIILSTDSKRYMNFLKKYNYKYPKILRPKSIAKKNSTDLQVLQFELKRYEKILNKKFDYVALFQPTSPIRKINDIKKCINIIKLKKPDSLWTISKIDKKFNPIKQLIIKNNKINYYSAIGHSFKSRQLLNDTFIRNGVAYFFSRRTILKYKKILPSNTLHYEITSDYANIDSIEDLKFATNYFS